MLCASEAVRKHEARRRPRVLAMANGVFHLMSCTSILSLLFTVQLGPDPLDDTGDNKQAQNERHPLLDAAERQKMPVY